MPALPGVSGRRILTTLPGGLLIRTAGAPHQLCMGIRKAGEAANGCLTPQCAHWGTFPQRGKACEGRRGKAYGGRGAARSGTGAPPKPSEAGSVGKGRAAE